MKKYFNFVIGRYFEFAILAFLPLFLASRVEPDEFVRILSITVVSQFTSFISSIFGSVYLKRFISEISFESGLIFSVFVNILISFFLSFWLFEVDVAFVFILSLFNVFRSYQQNIFRAQGEVDSLTKFNFIYPCSFIIIFFISTFIAIDVNGYLISQSLAFFVCFLFVILNNRKKSNYITIHKMFSDVKDSTSLIFNYFLLNFSTYLFSQGDKVFLASVNSDGDYKGSYLLFDNISNIYYLGFSAIGYALMPKVLLYFKSNDNKANCLKLILISFFVFLIFGFFWFIISEISVKLFYPMYSDFIFLLTPILLIKVIMLLMFIPDSYLIAIDKERWISVVQYISLLPLFVFLLFSDFEMHMYLYMVMISLIISLACKLFLVFRVRSCD